MIMHMLMLALAIMFSQAAAASGPPHRQITQSASKAPWAPPVCGAKPRGARRIGQWMQFTIPRHLRIRRGQDVDYRTESITIHGAWMQFGAGPHWSSGFPPSRTLAQMVHVEEREVKTPNDGVALADYAGVRADGSRWRTLVMFGESITYDHANASAAAQFDAIIASLCFSPK